MKDKPKDNPLQGPKKKFNFYWIYAIMAIAFFAMYFYGTEPQEPKEIMWQRFENEMLAKHHIEKIVVVNKEFAEIHIKKDVVTADSSYKDAVKGKDNMGPHYTMKFLSPESFQTQLAAAEDRIFAKDTVGKTPQQIAELEKTRHVNVVPEERTNWGSTILVNWILPIAILVGICFLIMRMINRKNKNRTEN